MEWLKRTWSRLSIEIVGSLIMLAVTSLATIRAIALSWSSPLIILLVVGFLALSLLIINQIHIVKQRHSRGFASMKNEKIEATLKKWLDKEKYKISSDSKPDMLFQFNAEDDAGRSIIIARSKSAENFIAMGGIWNIAPDDQKKFNDMDDDIRTDMLEELQKELLRFGVNYIGLEHPLVKLGVELKIPCDETCTQSFFIQTFTKVKFAYMLMTVVMQKGLRRSRI